MWAFSKHILSLIRSERHHLASDGSVFSKQLPRFLVHYFPLKWCSLHGKFLLLAQTFCAVKENKSGDSASFFKYVLLYEKRLIYFGMLNAEKLLAQKQK